MSDDDNDADGQYDVLAVAHESMNSMLAETCAFHDSSFNSYDANDQTLDNAVLHWWGLLVLGRLDNAPAGRFGRVAARADRALVEAYTGALYQWDRNASAHLTASDDDDDEDGDEDGDIDDPGEEGDEPSIGKGSRRQ